MSYTAKSVYLKDEIILKIEAFAESQNRSFSFVLNDILEEFLKFKKEVKEDER